MRTVRYAGHVSLVQDTALLYMGRYVSMVQAGDHVDFPIEVFSGCHVHEPEVSNKAGQGATRQVECGER